MGDENGNGNGNGAGNGNGTDDGNGGSGSEFPERDIEIVAPADPGGSIDLYARLVAGHLADHLPNDVNVTVSNVAGAAARVGADEVYQAEPDGYTLCLGHLEAHTTGQILYDPMYELTEFTHLGQIGATPRSWFGNADATDEYDSWDALVEGMTNGELLFATQGAGATGHIIGIVAGDLTGDYSADDLDFVHYSGTGEMTAPLIRGDQHVGAATHSTTEDIIEDEDDIGFYFIMGESDEWTTAAEFGMPSDAAETLGDQFTTPYGLYAPPDTPDDVTEILRDSLYDTLQDDAVQADAEEQNLPIEPVHGDEFQDFVGEFYEGWLEYEEVMADAVD
ncbi:Bug family tripartite tricarboxylate transporter substrate binding protein [Natrialba swarupiae]|nr:tripartite tricarboxylate transporter substrate-binding protein [Natrialba swarupiae]